MDICASPCTRSHRQARDPPRKSGRTRERVTAEAMVTAEASGTPGSATWTQGASPCRRGACRPEVTARSLPHPLMSQMRYRIGIGRATEPQRSHDGLPIRKGQRAPLRWVLARRMPLVAKKGIHVAVTWRCACSTGRSRRAPSTAASCGGDRPVPTAFRPRWFTLFFIPVIPLNAVGEHVQCTTCKTRYVVDVLNQPTTAQMQTALPRACEPRSAMLRSGDPL